VIAMLCVALVLGLSPGAAAEQPTFEWSVPQGSAWTSGVTAAPPAMPALPATGVLQAAQPPPEVAIMPPPPAIALDEPGPDYEQRFNEAGCSVAIDEPVQTGPISGRTISGGATLSCDQRLGSEGPVGRTFVQVCLQTAAPLLPPLPLPWPFFTVASTCRQQEQWGNGPNRVATSWSPSSCYRVGALGRFRMRVTTAVRLASPVTGTLLAGPVRSQTFTGLESTLCW